jgi:hypothetical protein
MGMTTHRFLELLEVGWKPIILLYSCLISYSLPLSQSGFPAFFKILFNKCIFFSCRYVNNNKAVHTTEKSKAVALFEEMPVIPVNKVVDEKRIIGK